MADSTGLLSKNTTLGYQTSGSTTYTTIANIMEVPEMGGKPDKVEVTTLADSNKRYIAGLTDPGDLAFKFLYDNSTATSAYRILKGLEGQTTNYEVTYPDGTTHAFTAQVSVSMDAIKPSAALTFTATMLVNSAIVVTPPTGS